MSTGETPQRWIEKLSGALDATRIKIIDADGAIRRAFVAIIREVKDLLYNDPEYGSNVYFITEHLKKIDLSFNFDAVLRIVIDDKCIDTPLGMIYMELDSSDTPPHLCD